MNRRDVIRLIGTGSLASFIPGIARGSRVLSNGYYAAGLKKPVSVYITWAAHDELSDTVALTEELAMKEFDALLRMKKLGVQFDYYLMDMFWFDKDSGYRAFKKEAWPNGPDRWLKACKENGILPGLWLSTNVMGWGDSHFMNQKEEWNESADKQGQLMSLHKGNFINYHIETMQQWYDKGIRIFKFDFANFWEPLAGDDDIMLKVEHERRSEDAWIDALKRFRAKNPEVVLLAYNGYGGIQWHTKPGFKKSVQLKWLEVFDSLYCGDPRPSDVPCMNFWRSKDIYSDHMVFEYEWNGVPLPRIDNTAFMIGNTGTCYYRNKQAWKGMLILSGARGGWMNTYYGNMDLLSDEDAKWFARAQKMYLTLQEFGQSSVFGNVPGSALPYGFKSKGQYGTVITIVNPSQSVQTVDIPEARFEKSRIQFHDAGFVPVLQNNKVTLGPEQLVVVGMGEYADTKYDLGIQDDVIIPVRIAPLEQAFDTSSPNMAKADVSYTGKGDLRIVFRQTNTDDMPERITGNSSTGDQKLGAFLSIKASQGGKELPLVIHYNKRIWSGLSWAVAEISNKTIQAGVPVNITYTVINPKNVKTIIRGELFEVFYK